MTAALRLRDPLAAAEQLLHSGWRLRVVQDDRDGSAPFCGDARTTFVLFAPAVVLVCFHGEAVCAHAMQRTGRVKQIIGCAG